MRAWILSVCLAVAGCGGPPPPAAPTPPPTDRTESAPPAAAPRVEVGGLAIDAHEVTVAAYRRCVEAGACSPAGTRSDWVRDFSVEEVRAQVATSSPFCNALHEDRDAHPVNCVNQAQAMAYCAHVGGRLPTAAEWTAASEGVPNVDDGSHNGCLPGCDTEFEDGEGQDTVEGTAPVGSFARDRSAAGAMDMLGNVREWTTDPPEPDGHGGFRTLMDALRNETPSVLVAGAGFLSPDRNAPRDEGGLTMLESGLARSDVGFRCAFPAERVEAEIPAPPTAYLAPEEATGTWTLSGIDGPTPFAELAERITLAEDGLLEVTQRGQTHGGCPRQTQITLALWQLEGRVLERRRWTSGTQGSHHFEVTIGLESYGADVDTPCGEVAYLDFDADMDRPALMDAFPQLVGMTFEGDTLRVRGGGTTRTYARGEAETIVRRPTEIDPAVGRYGNRSRIGHFYDASFRGVAYSQVLSAALAEDGTFAVSAVVNDEGTCRQMIRYRGRWAREDDSNEIVLDVEEGSWGQSEGECTRQRNPTRALRALHAGPARVLLGNDALYFLPHADSTNGEQRLTR